jgi:Arc/MetJ-type ribon-helix-helix transcriptional regulator
LLHSLCDFNYDINMRKHNVKRPASRGRSPKTARNLQTTLRLPKHLYESIKSHVQRDQTVSVNEFIVNALAAYVRAVERKAIDDAFLGMADDRQYQREALMIAEQFAASDAEALELSERDLIGA